MIKSLKILKANINNKDNKKLNILKHIMYYLN